MWVKTAKVIDYIIVVGDKNIRQYISSGMQPFGNPWFVGGSTDANTLHQILVRYEDPIEAEQSKSKAK